MFIPGAPTFAEPVQGTIVHIIMMNYARRIEILPDNQSEAMILMNLRIEIQLFHDQMKFPWGQIVMLERNALCVKPINQYYAIKALTNVVKIINRENFIKLLLKTDQDFRLLWQEATKEVIKFYEDMKDLEILDLDHVTASTVALYTKTVGKENDLNKKLIKAVNRVKIAWQSVWAKFNQTRKCFDYVLSDKNENFDIKLTNTQPTVRDEIMIMLSVNDNNEVRLWARSNISLFKARIANRHLKWVETERIFTTSEPTWWLYAIKRFDLDQESNTYANICRPETFTTDY
jgi:hypothetical protein